ncbi:MAG: hypothetical protein QOI64_1622 [Solirubrobacteraceae bacterium]|nr:hypothetical protein [Solirubrobacteraceae bacterium]
MARGEGVKRFLRGLAKFVALVLVAGGVGVVLGMGLSNLAEDDEPSATGATASVADATPAPAAAEPTATVTTTTMATTTTSPTPAPAPSPLSQIRVSVLDARLFTDSSPSGRQEQRARVTVRIRAENAGARRVTLDRPVLRVGSVRVQTDRGAEAAGSEFDPLAAGASQTVTLHFSLAGEATPKLVRDRRARILIAGQSLAMRVKVRAPTR